MQPGGVMRTKQDRSKNTADSKSLKLTIAHSEDVDTTSVVEELLEQTASIQGERSSKGALLFTSAELDHKRMLERICEAFPDIALIGCTTDGELSSVLGFREDSTVFAIFSSSVATFSAGCCDQVRDDPGGCARRAVEQAQAGLGGQQPRLCLTTPDSLCGRGSSIIDGLRTVLGKGLPIVGGTAADNWRFVRTSQFCGKRVGSDLVPVLLVAGPIRSSVGVASGWTPIGRTVCVTSVEGNALHELDNKPALDYYTHYLGVTETPPSEHPLSVLDRDLQLAYLRAPVAYDRTRGAVHFASEIPSGAWVQMSETTQDGIIEASRESVQQAQAGFNGRPDVAVVVSSAARKYILGPSAAREMELIERQLPDIPLVGFYSYGEIYAGPNGQPTCFHNATLVTLLLGFDPTDKS